MTEAYPLAWPAGRPRTPPEQRQSARFKTSERQYHQTGGSWLSSKPLTVARAIDRLALEVERMQRSLGSRFWKPVISTNIETRQDGTPRSDRRDPADPGVAVYFRANTKDYCMPCDRWNRVADNIAAIAGHIEAIRRIERYGVQTLDAAFAGFEALPPPGNRPWRDVLECRNTAATIELIEASYRRLARERHPDLGGSDEMMAELNAAIEAARGELAA